MNPRMSKWSTGLLILSLALSAPGCRKPVYFPPESLKATAEALGAAGAYDTNGDGRADFFTFADAGGRITRIAYETRGDGRPDRAINLDQIDADRCRHLVLILDGFAYDLVKRYYDAGGLRMFYPPSRLIAPYPTMTDLALEDLLGYIPSRAYEALYFDHRENRLVGGRGDYLAGRNEPYNALLDYRAPLIWDAIGYLQPWAVFGKEVNDAKRLFDRRASREMLAYFVSSAGLGTVLGAEGQVRALRRIEQLVNQVIWETRGLTKITLLADHGHSYTPAERIDLEGYLKEKGWHIRSRITGPGDVVPVAFGLVTFASFATLRPAELAEDLVGCEGVELVSFVEQDDVIVLSPDGGSARIQKRGDRYRYRAEQGDPLRLKPLLALLEGDQEGFYPAEALTRATATHEYPAPLQRLWRAHMALVENPADVLVSLADRFCFGSKSFAGAVRVASTHGSLNAANSVTFIMSTVGPLPQVMHSADVPAAMSKLLGRPWPMGD